MNKNLDFHKLRKPFYLDNDTLLVRTPSAKHMNTSHAEWFSSEGIPYLHTVRGYYMPSYDGSEEYLMIYSNDFEIDRKSTPLNSSHTTVSRMPSSA